MISSLQVYRYDRPHFVVNIDEQTFFSHVVMGEHIISSSFISDGPLDIDEGDYVILGGERFSINKTLPPVTKSAVNKLTYNLQFQGYIYDLHYCAYRHLGSAEFELFATADVFIGIMVGCLNNIYSGWSVGMINVTEPKLIQFFENGKGFSCKGAIIKIAEAFGLEFWLTGKTLNLTAQAGVDTNITFEYGRGRGLYEIVRGEIDNELYFNRLYVEGSTRNIPVGYRGGMKRLQIDVPYLQLDIPAGKRIRETSVVIDEIFPKRVGTITAVSTDQLTITDTSIDFDLNGSRIEGEKATVEMLTGENSGQSFEIDKYNHATKTIILVPNTGTNGEVRPNATFEIKPGDQYFFAGIKVPDSYIATAEADLKAEGVKLLKKAAAYVPPYSVRVSDKFMRDNGLKINAGDRVRLKDAALGIDAKIRVSAVKFSLVDPYTVDLLVSDVIPYTSEDKNIIEIGKTKKETVVVNKINAEKARRNMLDMRRLQKTIFDPDGYFDPENIKPNSIETLMLSVGAKSQNFGLNGVSINANTNGDPNFLTITSGSLIHYEVEIKGLGYVWQIGSAQLTDLDPTKTYYISAKCRMNALSGEWYVSDVPMKTESEPGYYHFNIGILYPVDQGSRGFDFTNGMTFIVGDRITTGRIQSIDKQTWFDLNTGEVRGKFTFTSGADVEETIGNVADEKINELADALGSLAYADAIEKAQLGETIIQGGYIRSELIQVITLIANNLIAGPIKITAANGNMVFEDSDKNAIMMIDDDGAIEGVFSTSTKLVDSPDGSPHPDFLYSRVVRENGVDVLRHFYRLRGPGMRFGLSPLNSSGYSDVGRKGYYTNGKFEASYDGQGITFTKDGFNANGKRSLSGHVILENKVNAYRVLIFQNGLLVGVNDNLAIGSYVPLSEDTFTGLPSNNSNDTGYNPVSNLPPGDGEVEPPSDPNPPVTMTSLKQKFDYPIGFTVKSGFTSRTTEYKSVYRKHGDRIGPENAFKMHIFQPEENVFRYAEIDAIIAECVAYNLDIHLHCITWADVNAVWLRNKEGIWTQAQFRSYLINHITTLLTYLLPHVDRIKGIDSINEAFGPTGLKESFWGRVLPDWMDVTVSTVRSIMPNVPQFINDYDFEDSNAKGPTVINWINQAATRGIIIDGIGSQSHSSVSLNMIGYEPRLKTLANSGKLIHISELDVILKPGSATSPTWATSETWLRDDQGNPVPELDSNGNPELDSNGNPVYKFKPRNQIELEILRSSPPRLAAHSKFFTENHRLYQKCVPPAQRYGITVWNVGIADSGINFPQYKDFPGMFFNDYTPTPAVQDLLDMTIVPYTP